MGLGQDGNEIMGIGRNDRRNIIPRTRLVLNTKSGEFGILSLIYCK